MAGFGDSATIISKTTPCCNSQEDAAHRDHGKTTKTPRALNWPRHSVVVLLLLRLLPRLPPTAPSVCPRGRIDEFLGVDDGSPNEYRAAVSPGTRARTPRVRTCLLPGHVILGNARGCLWNFGIGYCQTSPMLLFTGDPRNGSLLVYRVILDINWARTSMNRFIEALSAGFIGEHL